MNNDDSLAARDSMIIPFAYLETFIGSPAHLVAGERKAKERTSYVGLFKQIDEEHFQIESRSLHWTEIRSIEQF